MEEDQIEKMFNSAGIPHELRPRLRKDLVNLAAEFGYSSLVIPGGDASKAYAAAPSESSDRGSPLSEEDASALQELEEEIDSEIYPSATDEFQNDANALVSLIDLLDRIREGDDFDHKEKLESSLCRMRSVTAAHMIDRIEDAISSKQAEEHDRKRDYREQIKETWQTDVMGGKTESSFKEWKKERYGNTSN